MPKPLSCLTAHMACRILYLFIRWVCAQVPQQWMKYIFAKGFIAVDGISLTVSPQSIVLPDRHADMRSYLCVLLQPHASCCSE